MTGLNGLYRSVQGGDRLRAVDSVARSGIALAGVLLASAASLLAAPPAGAQPFTQCPAVGVDTSCQYLITVTNAGTTVAQDPSQGPYESSDDSLLGVQNSSSRAITALPLSGPAMFGFEGDGLCDPGSGAVPSGCVPVPGSPAGTTCGPQSMACSFPPPPGEPPNYTDFFEGSPPLAWPNGDRQNGYEGPTSWFTVTPTELSSATVNFSPAIPPGGSTYFSVESPPSASSIKVGAPATTTPAGSKTPALPPAFGPNGAIQGLPSAKVCLSKRHFKIHIRHYAAISYLEAIVFVNKKKNKVTRSTGGRFTSPIDLRGFPKGTFVVKITVITTTGGIIVGKRTYHTCRRKLKPRGHGRL